MIVFDHVLILTPDVGATADRLLEEHGLATVDGGRHAGHGTANRIVPLGPDYLELMYVADAAEAAASPMGRWALDGTARGTHVAALMLRTDDVGPHVQRLGLDTLDLSRQGPGGEALSWRLAGLDRLFAGDPRPVLMECRMSLDLHPGRQHAEHRVTPTGIAWIEGGEGVADLRDRLGPVDLDVRSVPGLTGYGRVGVATTSGELVIDL